MAMTGCYRPGHLNSTRYSARCSKRLKIPQTGGPISPQLVVTFYLTADIKHRVVPCFLPGPGPLTELQLVAE